jgi:hypothetical protein
MESYSQIVLHFSISRPNYALEGTAARRAFTFQMIKAVLDEAPLDISGGRSAWSR